jgi:hypothetical protein
MLIEPSVAEEKKRDRWQHYRTVFTILVGSVLIFIGVSRSDSAMMTVGGGLVGFSPAAKGP